MEADLVDATEAIAARIGAECGDEVAHALASLLEACTEKIKTLETECERLHGLLGIARAGLERASDFVVCGLPGVAVTRIHDSLRRSDPDAETDSVS